MPTAEALVAGRHIQQDGKRRHVVGVFKREKIGQRPKQAIVRRAALPLRSLLWLALRLLALLLTVLLRG